MIVWLLITVVLLIKTLQTGVKTPNNWFLVLVAWLAISIVLANLGHPTNLGD
jgi:ABC-type transport system involved in multi-copper enzyme maturation permease subunit